MAFALVFIFLVGGVMVADAEECKDLVSICSNLYRFCGSADYGKWMTSHCPDTCGYCALETTTPPSPPTLPPAPPVIAPDPPACGVPSIKGIRVVGGKDAVRGSWPWQILMLYNGYPMCGGALISPRWVVSAAHCIFGDEEYPELFTIRTGEHDRDVIEGSEIEYDVETLITHPDYDPMKLDNDIALVRLKQPVLLNKYTQPVCLPDDPPNVGDECYITGWGKTKSDGTMTKVLQQGKLPIVSQETCHKLNMANIEIPVTDAMICGGSGGENTLSGCHGDSGGPYVCEKDGRWFLQGAVSHGSARCNSTETYTVFSKVSYFRDWIDETMNANNKPSP